MTYNVISSLDILYPLIKDQKRYQLISDKVTLWMMLNKEKMNTINATLTAQKNAVNNTIKHWHAVSDLELNSLDEQGKIKDTLSQAKSTYYKTAIDFINNQVFPFTFRAFYNAILAAAPLDKEGLDKILAHHHCSADKEAITAYLTDWTSKKQPDHLKFFYDLNQKLNNEDEQTSKEMVALFCFQALSEYSYFSSKEYISCQNPDKSSVNLTLHDFIFLLMRYLLAAKEIPATTFNLLDQFIPSLNNSVTASACNGSPDKEPPYQQITLYETKAGVTKMLSDHFVTFITLGITDTCLFEFISSREDLLNRLDPNNSHLLTHPDDQEVKLPLSFLILEYAHENKAIFTNLLTALFFKKISLDKAFIKKNKLYPIISNLLCNATEANTAIWTQLDPVIFTFIDPKEARALCSRYPDIIGALLINKILKNARDSGDRYLTPAEAEAEDINNLKHPQTKAEIRHTSIKELCSNAQQVPITLASMLDNQELMEMIGFHLMTFFIMFNFKKISIQSLVLQIDSLHQKSNIWDHIFSQNLFTQIEHLSIQDKRTFLSLSKHLKEKHSAELARLNEIKKSAHSTTKPTVNKAEQRKANKAFYEQQKQQLEKKSAPPVKLAPSKSQPSQSTITLAHANETSVLTLTDEQRKTFVEGFCAVVAGNPTVKFEWFDAEQHHLGYFMVNFAALGNEFKISKPHKQDDDTWVMLTDEARDNFFNTYVPSTLKTGLGDSITVSVTADGKLRITPQKDRCDNPQDLHAAAFKHLSNHGKIIQKGSSVNYQAAFMYQGSLKKADPHRSLLSQPKESLTHAPAQTINVKQEASQAPAKPLDSIKKMWSGIIQDIYPEQPFHFLDLALENKHFVININTKGVPCLSNQTKQIDTYIVMKSIVATLQEQYGEEFITLKPANELDPKKYKGITFSVALKEMSSDKLQSIATDASQHLDLKKSFATFLEIYNSIAGYYKKCNACNLEIQGRASPVMVAINEPLEIQDPICKSYRNLAITHEQRACLDALFEELKSITLLLEKYKEDASRLLATKSRQIICYHRIFHNLTWVFHENQRGILSLHANTLRDAYRHGYFKMSVELNQFIEKLSLVLMKYEKMTALPAAHLYSPAKTHQHISFEVTQSMHAELAAKLNTFLQEKWNHTIGVGFKEKRMELATTLKNAMKEISVATNIPTLEKQSMLVAMASRIGESDKTSMVYAGTYGRLGTHDHHLTMLPEHLTTKAYHEFVDVNEAQHLTKIKV